jgi:hypothetical protein
MKPLCHVVMLSVCLAACGCKVPKQDVELLERDLRMQEDEIYALRDCVDTYEQKLAACRSENRALRKELSARGGAIDDFTNPGIPSGSGIPAIELAPGQTLPPGMEPQGPVEIEPRQLQEAPPFRSPQISPPDSAHPDGALMQRRPLEEVSPADLVPAGAASSIDTAAPNGSETELAQHTESRSRQLLDRLRGGNQEPAILDPVRDLEVTEITLNKMLTGGMNRDKRHGDEGIMVVVEPRNAKNQIVEAFGDISVVVLDPALEGEEARVARWDITSQELEHRFRSRQLGRGFQLQLPWPGEAPEHSTLHLFVRYVSADGRKLIVDRPLEIDPPGGAKDGGWVPATRTDVVTQEQGPSLMSGPEGAVSQPVVIDDRVVEPEAEVAGEVAVPTAPSRRSRDAVAQHAEPSRKSDLGSQPAEARVAQAPKEEPAPPAKKKRPSWTPYR